jgi:Outer membrane protein beta-barrel domain
MRSVNWLLAAAMVSGLSGTAWAQTSTPPPTPVAPAIAPADDAGLTRSHWLASGFVGGNFGSINNDAFNVDNSRSFDWGGQIGYLWRGVVGGEFLANFTPSFGVDTLGVLVNDNPHVNSYMANAIGVLPLGAKAQFQPYISGGFGGIQMRFANGIVGSGIIVNGVVVADVTNSSVSQTGWGENVGAGIMAFAGKVGFRGDARYYHANTFNNLDATNLANQVTKSLLSDLNFWRADVGVAFQW